MLNYNNKEMANIIYTNYFDHINLFKKLKKEGRIVNTPFRNTVRKIHSVLMWEWNLPTLMNTKNVCFKQ